MNELSSILQTKHEHNKALIQRANIPQKINKQKLNNPIITNQMILFEHIHTY